MKQHTQQQKHQQEHQNQNTWKLRERIIEKSKAKQWWQARDEWEVERITVREDATCLCGKHPIRYVNIMRNIHTEQKVRIGRCCVKKFAMHGSGVMDAVLRVFADIRKPLNEETICMARRDNIITQKEYDFYTDTIRKRKMTGKQIEWRKDINRKIIGAYT